MRSVTHFSILCFILIFSFLIETKAKSRDSRLRSSIHELSYFIEGKGTAKAMAFFIKSRILVTNFHVIYPLLKEGNGNLDSIKLSQFLKDRTSYVKVDSPFKVKRVLALSLTDDLAILETKEKSKNYLSFRESPLSINEDLFVAGYSSGKFVKLKKISPLHKYFMSIKRSFFVEEIEVTALESGSPEGMSGGPIIDQYGKVVGILVAGSKIKNLLVFVNMDQKRFNSLMSRTDDSSFIGSDISAKDRLNQAIEFAYNQANKGHFDTQHMLSVFSLNMKGNKEESEYWLRLANNNPSNIIYSFTEDKQMEDFLMVWGSLNENFYSLFNDESFDSRKGILQLEQAAHLGSGRAIVGLMEVYWKGRFVENNLTKATSWALKAVEQNYISVLDPLEKGIREGDSKAFIILKNLAEETNKNWVQFRLSEMYFLKGNVSEGLKLLEKLAENRYPEAQFKLAQMYLNLEGSVVERNFSRAFELLKPVAESGHSEAQFQLALMYRDGKGVEKNLKAAEDWLKHILSSKGNFSPLAYLVMGKMKRNGDLKDQIDAELYLTKAIENGVPAARLELVNTFLGLLSILEEGETDGIEKLNVAQIIIESKIGKFESASDVMPYKNLKKSIEIVKKTIEEFLTKAIIHLTILASEGSSFGQLHLNQLKKKYNFMALAALVTSSLNKIVGKDIDLFNRLKAFLELGYWYTNSIRQYGVRPVHDQVRELRNKCHQIFKDPSSDIQDS